MEERRKRRRRRRRETRNIRFDRVALAMMHHSFIDTRIGSSSSNDG